MSHGGRRLMREERMAMCHERGGRRLMREEAMCHVRGMREEGDVSWRAMDELRGRERERESCLMRAKGDKLRGRERENCSARRRGPLGTSLSSDNARRTTLVQTASHSSPAQHYIDEGFCLRVKFRCSILPQFQNQKHYSRSCFH